MTRSISKHDPGSRGRYSRAVRGHALAAPLLWGVVILALLVSACTSGTTGHGDLARDKQILASCPSGKKLASKLDIDASGSTRTPELDRERTDVLAAVVRRTAICSGHLEVALFATSSTTTVQLFGGALELPGATTNARLRRVQRLVDEVVGQVAGTYQAAIKGVSPKASDIVGLYRVGAEYLRQLGSGYQLNLVILTDGIQTAGFTLGSKPLTKTQAAAVASRVSLPKLPGDSSITVAGIGRVSSGTPVSSAVAEGLTLFYDELCKRTGSGTCVSVTDYTVAGR